MQRTPSFALAKTLGLCALLLALSACGHSRLATAIPTTASTQNHSLPNPPTLRHAPQIAQAQVSTVGYFDSEGHYTPEKQADSAYFRQKLGQDSQGRSVVQDFYVWQQRPQTSPYALSDAAALTHWDNADYVDGEFVFYDPTGRVSSHVNQKNGAYIGLQRHYHANGSLFKLSRYDYFGNPLQTTYYRPNGKPIYQVTFDLSNQDPRAFVLFNAQGEAYPAEQLNAAIVQQAEADIAATINGLRAHTARLAHFSPPQPVAIKLPFKPDAIVAGQCQKHTILQLTGMQNLSDAKIKTISGASQIRRAADNEAVEDDFRPNRITVFLKPNTQRISSAFCG